MAAESDRLAVYLPALAEVRDALARASKDLLAAKQEFDGNVVKYTGIWVNSGSQAALAWKDADRKIGMLIGDLQLYTQDFSNTTDQVLTNFKLTEIANGERFATRPR